eukprot:TRINITY_DN1179_c0_g1_i1.p1 TRINITY_DN1179_c0_g1~~TRINITY_DN1179_c0_g1_i1.p1  ORF type:complete len:268 (-),score=34.42 TRINITY_DN1179_c0_g1_i1:202-1005(-)
MTIEQAARHASQAAVAMASLAQVEATSTKSLSTLGYIVFRANPTFAGMAQGLLDALPTGFAPTRPPWERVFNSVEGTRLQLNLSEIGTRSPYQPAKKFVINDVAPLINRTLFGLKYKDVSRPSILLSKKTEAAHALAQGAHRDWPLNRLKGAIARSTSFPISVLLSLHDGGDFNLWPGSFDATEVREEDRITLTLNAGDLIMFHGALVHEGVGYEGEEGDVHMRVHFYTQNATGVNAWPIENETERVHMIRGGADAGENSDVGHERE